ncbi:MAG TPA: ABC transporter ATP-binding protein [Candidatus Limnocylindrales bacterium]|jgi:ABC-type multidrug transport system fused ATPase/permease subunit|nr:ABC transporter ATP-binding protein [Candidatus Limnocylindrales bacterium]
MMHHFAHGDPTFVAKSRSSREILRRVARYLLPYKFLAAATIGCATLSLLFSLAYPKLTQFVIDDVIAQKRIDLLMPMMLALLGAFLLRDLFNSLRIRINNTFEQNVIYDMRREVYARLQRLPVNYFDQRASGDLMTRVIEDVNSVERVLIDGTEQGTLAVLGIVGVAVIMFATNPALALVAMIPLPILTGGALWYTLTAHRRYRAQREAASAMNALLMDNLQGVRQIKAFGREDHEDSRFAQRADDLRKGTLGVMRVWAAYSPAMTFAGALGLVLVLWIGGRQVLADRMTLGQLVGFMFYLALFYEPIARLHGLNQMMAAARAAGERVFDILDAPVERVNAPPGGTLREPVRGEVIYENVSFGYNPDRAVLRNVSLRAAPGEMTALVGPTGSGKSTLVNLLPAFYELSSGRIIIDGQDISAISLESLRAHISVVSQEAFLFNGTIRENILYGRLAATEADLLEASKAANCHEFISRLPEGYNSRVGERGVKLSVGEKQRVSIARALLKNAPLLILDEATASVDTATEKLIQEALERLMANRTSFVIAHRLSTIRKADQILVMRHGQIIERGTHEELFALNGLYSTLARIQGTAFIEESFELMEG